MCVGIEGYAIAGYIMHICNTFRLITEKKIICLILFGDYVQETLSVIFG